MDTLRTILCARSTSHWPMVSGRLQKRFSHYGHWKGRLSGNRDEAAWDHWFGRKLGSTYKEYVAERGLVPKQWLGFKSKHTFLVWLENAVPVLRTAAEVRRWPDISWSVVYQRMGIQEAQEDDPYANLPCAA